MNGGDRSGSTGLRHWRDIRIRGHAFNSYKVFLGVGIYVAIVSSAAVGARSGISPLRLGAGCLVCALVGMIGARLYHLALYFRVYRTHRVRAEVWNTARGGWSLFGGLLIVPFSLLWPSMFGIPLPVFWDHLVVGIVCGAVWIRFGCVCNGCCAGRESHSWLALGQPDIRGIHKRRIPVEWFEIGWWLIAGFGLILLWPLRLPPGCYALGVLAWYGLGRFWLEPLREQPDLVWGFVRIDQVVAALLALTAGGRMLAMLVSR